MKRFQNFRRKFISTDLPMRLCIFNMMTLIGLFGSIVSLATTYAMDIHSGQIYSVGLAPIALIVLMYVANGLKKLNLAAILICVTVGFIIFPLIFFGSGGIHSGMPVWFMIAIVFSAIIIEGKMKYVISGGLIGLYAFLIYYALVHPEKIHYLASDQMVFLDVAQSVIFGGSCILLILAFQMYMYDLAYKRAEESAKEAEKAREEAVAANTAKSSFLANMSHEIRTPLGVIIGMNEMIQRESDKESVLDYSKDVDSSAKTLLSIINDILDFSKIESGMMNIIEAEYDLSSLIRDVLNIGRVKKEEKGIDFDIVIDPELPSKLKGDDLRIKECLINLISNAFKYTEKGKVTFEVSGQREGENEYVMFSVTDTGRGIREEEMPKLFESFVRLDENHNRNIQGTGLGLNITNRLLNLMGSKLEVESEYQKGSKFFFMVRQDIVDEAPISFDEGGEENEKKKNGNTMNFEAPNAKVLVVDDSTVNLKMICGLMKSTQMKTVAVKSGFDAVKILQNHTFDLIFLDHMMPDMDGEETFALLREKNLLGDTPVIMLTANATVGMREHFIEIGFNDYLSKPIDFHELERILKTYVKGD